LISGYKISSATFAYLADVFFLEEHRGIGISKWIMTNIIKHPNLQGIRCMALATSDVHGRIRRLAFLEWSFYVI
jgi:GNAT superfamily N-acetyltransferase